ncbi:MAG: DNA polymerase III subunit beta [Thermodesulfovibrionales bacterium]|nr:DNA polymerase III subunit beta [Thermodesulfovibrionales bacterium]
MKIKVQKDLLQKKLSNIQGILDKGGSLLILNHFLLNVNKEWSFIMATDLETAYREKIDVEIEEEGKLCIHGKKLYDFIRELEGTVSLESIDGNWLKVSSGKSYIKLACLPPEDYPIWPTLEGDLEMSLSASELIKLIERTLYAVKDIDSRLFLRGLLFRITGWGVLTVVGTDTHRLSVASGPVVIEKGIHIEGNVDVLLSRKSISEVKKALSQESDMLSVIVGRNHVCFRVKDKEFLIRRVEGTFPNYEQVIPINFEGEAFIGRDEFIRALKKVSILSKEKGYAVRITMEPNLMTISASDPDYGEAYDEIGIGYEGKPLMIALNAQYLLDSLLTMSSDRVLFKFNSPSSATMLQEEGTESYKCVVMPLRL